MWLCIIFAYFKRLIATRMLVLYLTNRLDTFNNHWLNWLAISTHEWHRKVSFFVLFCFLQTIFINKPYFCFILTIIIIIQHFIKWCRKITIRLIWFFKAHHCLLKNTCVWSFESNLHLLSISIFLFMQYRSCPFLVTAKCIFHGLNSLKR